MATQQEEVVVRMGMDTRPLEQQAGHASRFMEHFGKRISRAVDHIGMNLLGFSFIQKSEEEILDFWNRVTKKLAAIWQQQFIQDLTSDLQEFVRKQLHADVAARDKAAADREKALTEAAKERLKLLTEFEKAGADLADKRMSNEEKIQKTSEEINRLKKEIAGADLRSNETLQATIDLKKLQIHMEDLQRQKADADAKKREAQLKANEPVRKALAADLATGKFNPQLERMSALESDAALSSRLGNIARARTDMSIAAGIRNDIRSTLLSDLRAGNAETALQSATRQLLEKLAPISSDGEIPVRARILDEN